MRPLPVVAVALLASGCAWGEEGAIRARLVALVSEVNTPAPEGLALVAHAAAVGDYFTADALVDLGPGSAPIKGREMLIGMVARLKPRTAAYRVQAEDVDVRVRDDGASAIVEAMVILVPRRPAESEAPDAREFEIEMSKADGSWRIARLTAVQTLR